MVAPERRVSNHAPQTTAVLSGLAGKRIERYPNPIASPTPTPPMRAALGGLLVLAAAMGVGRFVFTPILPHMTEALGLTKAQAGWIASANYVGYLAGALAASHSRLSRQAHRWLGVALAVSGVTTLAMGLAAGMIPFLALRAVGGVASAFVLVYASALVLRRLADAKQTHLGAVYFAGVGIGVAGSAVLVSALVALGFDWRGLWIGSGVAALAASAIAIVLMPLRPLPPTAAAPAAAPGKGLPQLLAAYGLFGFGYIITATFLVAIARDAPAARPLEPYVWLIVGLAAAPSIAVWNAIAGKLRLGPAFALACVLEAIGVAASVLAPNVWGAGLAALLVGGTYMGITALGLQGARTRARDPAKALGLMTAGFGLGQIAGPVFAGQVAQVTGSLTVPSLVAAGALLVSAALTVRLAD
jgi:predicted MFS family arabinose efflux permease